MDLGHAEHRHGGIGIAFGKVLACGRGVAALERHPSLEPSERLGIERRDRLDAREPGPRIGLVAQACRAELRTEQQRRDLLGRTCIIVLGDFACLGVEPIEHGLAHGSDRVDLGRRGTGRARAGRGQRKIGKLERQPHDLDLAFGGEAERLDVLLGPRHALALRHLTEDLLAQLVEFVQAATRLLGAACGPLGKAALDDDRDGRVETLQFKLWTNCKISIARHAACAVVCALAQEQPCEAAVELVRGGIGLDRRHQVVRDDVGRIERRGQPGAHLGAHRVRWVDRAGAPQPRLEGHGITEPVLQKRCIERQARGHRRPQRAGVGRRERELIGLHARFHRLPAADGGAELAKEDHLILGLQPRQLAEGFHAHGRG